jgi:hypothetical protein
MTLRYGVLRRLKEVKRIPDVIIESLARRVEGRR